MKSNLFNFFLLNLSYYSQVVKLRNPVFWTNSVDAKTAVRVIVCFRSLLFSTLTPGLLFCFYLPWTWPTQKYDSYHVLREVDTTPYGPKQLKVVLRFFKTTLSQKIYSSVSAYRSKLLLLFFFFFFSSFFFLLLLLLLLLSSLLLISCDSFWLN